MQIDDLRKLMAEMSGTFTVDGKNLLWREPPTKGGRLFQVAEINTYNNYYRNELLRALEAMKRIDILATPAESDFDAISVGVLAKKLDTIKAETRVIKELEEATR